LLKDEWIKWVLADAQDRADRVVTRVHVSLESILDETLTGKCGSVIQRDGGVDVTSDMC